MSDPNWPNDGSVPPPPGAVPPPPGAVPPPPGAVPPPPAGAQKKRRWPWIVLAIVVCIGGCSAVVWSAIKGPIDTSNNFLELVQDGDYSGAAQMLDSTCFDDGGTAGSLQSIFGDGVEGYRLSGTSANSTNGTTTGAANGTITLPGDDERTIELRLTKPDDWMICGFTIGASGS